MLKLLTQRDIKTNWKDYRSKIQIALESSEGARVLVSGDTGNVYKNIYGRLLNPFNQDMHLWSEGNEDYLVLTQVQTCPITEKKTLVIATSTRSNEVDKETLDERYYEAYMTISKFAKENECVGMYCYSDLDYFAEMAKKTKDWTNVITRYQFYFPLN